MSRRGWMARALTFIGGSFFFIILSAVVCPAVSRRLPLERRQKRAPVTITGARTCPAGLTPWDRAGQGFSLETVLRLLDGRAQFTHRVVEALFDLFPGVAAGVLEL